MFLVSYVQSLLPCLQGLHFPRVSPCTQSPTTFPVPKVPAPPVPGMCSYLGTPARGFPSGAPGTGNRHDPRNQAGTGTALSPAATVPCSLCSSLGPRRAVELYQGARACDSQCHRQGAGRVWGGSHRAHSPLVPPGSRSGARSDHSSCPRRWAGRHRLLCYGHNRRCHWCSGRPVYPVGHSHSLQEGGGPCGAQPIPTAQAVCC